MNPLWVSSISAWLDICPLPNISVGNSTWTWGRTLGSPPAAVTGILCRQFPKITNTIIFRAKLVNSTWSKGKDPKTQRPQSWPWVRPCSHRGQQHQQDTQAPAAERRLCLFPMPAASATTPSTHKPSGYPQCQCQGLLTQPDKNGCNITSHCQTDLSAHTHTTETNDRTLLLEPLPQTDSSGWAGSTGKAGGFSVEEYPFRSALKPKQYFNRKQFLFLPRANKTKSPTAGDLDSIPVTKTTVSETPATLGNSSWRLTKVNVSAALWADIRLHWQHPLESSTSLIAAKWHSCFPH